MIRPASLRASAICARYCAFSASASVLRLLGPLEVVADALLAACSMFFTAGTPNFHMTKSSTRNASEPQMISLVAGRIGLGAFWQSSSRAAASSSFSTHSLGGLGLAVLRRRALSCANAGAAMTQHRDDDADGAR